MRAIIRDKDCTEFDTAERCFIKELVSANEDADLSIAKARVEPGVTTAWHRLTGVKESYLVMQGEGFVEVGSEAGSKVFPGDLVVIPADTRQRITNTGSSDLVFYCLCQPAFTADCYVDLDGQ